jgi:hypothetical protein
VAYLLGNLVANGENDTSEDGTSYGKLRSTYAWHLHFVPSAGSYISVYTTDRPDFPHFANMCQLMAEFRSTLGCV